MQRLLFSVLLCLAIGCESKKTPSIVPFDQVPAPILQKAQEALPDVKFDNAVRRSDGGLEVRGKDPQGKVRDVEFSPKGDVIEIE
jgi:hypothetical protein